MEEKALFAQMVASGVSGLTPYQPGKPIEALQRELGLSHIVKLASNENPLGCSPAVEAAMKEAMTEIYRYPDGSAFQLRTALVEFYERSYIQPENITFGNGSNDVLELIARAFLNPGDHAVYSQYSFAVYALACKAVNAIATEVPANQWGHDLTAILDAIKPETKLVFLANPNNPTGTWFDRLAWEAFLQKVPASTLVVLDEAYAEYIEAEDYPLGVDYLEQYPNLIVCKTFSKAYGLAGLRVGYALSTPEVADYLNRVRQPFNVNSIALQAATAALSDQAFVNRSREMNTQGLEDLAIGFKALGLSYIPSLGNFICVDVGRSGLEVFQELLQLGVIVRPVGNYGMDNYVRVSVGTPEETAILLESMGAVLKR